VDFFFDIKKLSVGFVFRNVRKYGTLLVTGEKLSYGVARPIDVIVLVVIIERVSVVLLLVH